MCLKIDIAGGGPTGLAFALTLLVLMPKRVAIRIFEPRWRREAARVIWRDEAFGNRRRRQIVTLQSMVFSRLPPSLRGCLFNSGVFSEMWPTGPDSPREQGQPRNLPICAIEDAWLDLLQNYADVELVCEHYDPKAATERDLLAICEGARSPTREHFIEAFGAPHPDMYQLNGKRLEETILGMQVETTIPEAEAVLLTVAQNRYLLNTLNGRGFLNMRLTSEEASEVVGLGTTGPVDCLQGRPCVMLRDGSGFRCPTHGTLFKPSMDPTSYLWPRVLEGLRLFGIDQEGLVAVNAFTFSLTHRPRFVAEIEPGTWGCLLGDAANAIHFWPGRGLNTGIKSALGLAGCLARRYRGAGLREADLCDFEGLMHKLQAREIGNRAWRTMLMRDEQGVPRPIQERITSGLEGDCDRVSLTQQLLAHMQEIRTRLEGRMSVLPSDQALTARLSMVSARTLKVLVETGPWILSSVGGPEVEVDTLPALP